MSLERLIIFSMLMTVLYPLKLSGMVGIGSFGLAILCFPQFIARAKSSHLIWLTAIFSMALIATFAASLKFPAARGEYIKGCITYAAALYTGYTFYVMFMPLPRSVLSSMCACAIFYVLSLSMLEIAVPPVRNLMTELSTTIYGGDSSLSDERDFVLHGGISRPLCGSQEPSWVGTALAVYVCGWGMLQSTPYKLTGWGIVTAISFVILRTATFMAASVSGYVFVFLHYIRRRNAVAILALFAMCVLIGAALTTIGSRLENMAAGKDASLNTRIMMPAVFCYVALRDTMGMGIGFIGRTAEPDNPNLRDFYPMVVETAQRVDLEYLLNLYDEKGMAFGTMSAAVFTHWTYHGLLFGFFSLVFWYYFSRSIDSRFGYRMFIFFFLFSGTLTYESVRTFPIIMLLTVFTIKFENKDEEYRLE